MVVSLMLGLFASISPCILPLYPGFLAYLSGSQGVAGNNRQRYWLGFFVLAGVLVMMLALGAGISLLAISIGQALSYIIPAADLLIIILGIFLLLDRNPFKALPQINVPLFSKPFANAFLYGLLYGPIALPCSGPLVVGIFAYSFSVGEAVSKLWIFFWFGIGFGLPLLVLSFISGTGARQITRGLFKHSRVMNRSAGLLLIGLAIFDLIANKNLIVSYLNN